MHKPNYKKIDTHIMKLSCPKNCSALHHPESGFYIKRLMAGENYVMPRGSIHSILFLMHGKVVVSSEECNEYEVTERCMVLCYKGYEYSITAKTNVEFIVAEFTALGGACDVSMLVKLFRRQANLRYEFESVPFNEPLRDFLSSMYRYLEDGIECRYLHYPSIQILFVLLRFYYPPKLLLRFFYNVLDSDTSFKALIENNRPKVKTLNELAEICGYDISTFNVLFRKHFQGITPYNWMQQERSKEIYHCICTSDMSIGDIASEYGFSNAGHLSTFCRKFWGMTPMKIRQKARAERKATEPHIK